MKSRWDSKCELPREESEGGAEIYRIKLLLHQPVKSSGHAGREIGHGHHRAVAGEIGQRLPTRTRQGIGIAHRVIAARFGLDGDHEVAVHGGWSKKDWRGPDPKAALDGKPCAGRHGGQRLGDGAARLKPRAAVERRAATSNHAARNLKPRAVLALCK